MRLILASSSPRRRELVASLGLPFEIIAPDIDETRGPDEELVAYVERLSREKAGAVAEDLGDEPALVLAADTIVSLDGDLLGKPVAAADARSMLRRLRGRAHLVITAVTLRRTAEPRQARTAHARTVVHMRGYGDDEIEAYINSGDPFDKAGGYAIQNQSFRPVARIEGSYSNVVGLPLDLVKAALSALSQR